MGYMPTAEGPYLAWSANFIDVVNQHKSAWGVPDAKVTEMQGLHSDIEALHVKCLSNEGTRTDRVNKNGKIVLLKHKQEALVAWLQAAEFMTDPWRLDLGITVRDSDLSPVNAPEDPPDWNVRSAGYLRLRFEISLRGEAKFAIPRGFNGAVIFYALSDEPITELSQLTKSQLLHKGISEMQLGPEADGKYFSGAMEWETHTNKHSPLSAIQSIKVR
ncbi:MAG: hypothetical protein MdMp014T_1161 [Treponematales bacterium]